MPKVVPTAPPTRGQGPRVVDATEKLRGVDEVVAEARQNDLAARKGARGGAAAGLKRKREGLEGLLDVIEADAAADHAAKRRLKAGGAGGSLKEQVADLGATALRGREKREYEAKRLERLGVPPPKAAKVPLKMLLGMRQKEREREENRRKYHKAMGLTVKKASMTATAAKAAKDAARAAGGHPAPETAQVGRFAGGVLQLSKRDMQTVVSQRTTVLGASALRSNAAMAAAAAKRRPSDYASRQKIKRAGGKKKAKKKAGGKSKGRR